MEPFPGDEIREGEAGVCAEQLGKMAAGESGDFYASSRETGSVQ